MRVYLTAALIAVFLLLPSCGETEGQRQARIENAEAAGLPGGSSVLWRDGRGWVIFQFGDKMYLLFRQSNVHLGHMGFAEYEGPIPPTGKGE